jgi:hypothetical protein
MDIYETCARLCRRLTSQLRRRRRGSVSAVAGEHLPNKCFGPLGERDQLALERFTGHRPQAQAAPHEPPGHQSPDSGG